MINIYEGFFHNIVDVHPKEPVYYTIGPGSKPVYINNTETFKHYYDYEIEEPIRRDKYE